MHYLLIYELVDDYIERRAEFRDEHLALAWKSHEQGNLVLGGALSDPADSAILLFKGNSPTAAEEFAKNDPYVKNNLVEKWTVRPWTTVVGKDASTPVKPDNL
jgi:uncharacterized protein